MKDFIYNIYDNIMYSLFGKIIHKQHKFTKYVKKLGFVFPQGEYCKNGYFTIDFDCYPYLIGYKGRDEFFTTVKEFKTFYNKYSKNNIYERKPKEVN